MCSTVECVYNWRIVYTVYPSVRGHMLEYYTSWLGGWSQLNWFSHAIVKHAVAEPGTRGGGGVAPGPGPVGVITFPAYCGVAGYGWGWGGGGGVG